MSLAAFAHDLSLSQIFSTLTSSWRLILTIWPNYSVLSRNKLIEESMT